MKLTDKELEEYKYEATMHENYLWTGSELLLFLDHIKALTAGLEAEKRLSHELYETNARLTAELAHDRANMQMITVEHQRMRKQIDILTKRSEKLRSAISLLSIGRYISEWHNPDCGSKLPLYQYIVAQIERFSYVSETECKQEEKS